ncbi:MAG: YfhO family protein, partial [Erysipelotrichaceae bacterium]|nr:YfhO family protein [Erysipelotrichaceae bacterium]
MKNKNYLITFIICLIITSFFLFPYIINNKLPLEHDTLFHLSRIEGYANALKHYDFIPRIYPLKNDGFGYASPLFYCDIFLLFPSLMYNLGFSLTTSYKFLIFFSTLFSCYSMYLLVHTITRNKYSAIISTIAYTFSNYHISDVYVRSSLGEILALIFFPLVLLGIYELFYTNKPKYIYLIIGFSGLLLSHNISFLLGV